MKLDMNLIRMTGNTIDGEPRLTESLEMRRKAIIESDMIIMERAVILMKEIIEMDLMMGV